MEGRNAFIPFVRPKGYTQCVKVENNVTIIKYIYNRTPQGIFKINQYE